MGVTNLSGRDGARSDSAAAHAVDPPRRDNLIDSPRIDPAVWLAVAAGALVGSVGVLSGDALWLVPLGRLLVHGQLPDSIPFATASSGGWHDVPAGAEVVFWAAYRLLGGARGLVALQAIACAVGFGALARGLRREASGGVVLVISALVLAGALPTLVVVGTTLFSVALFPLLVGLLEAESRLPTRRVWLAVGLIALWGNFHGEVIVGWGLLGCYLILHRARTEPMRAFAVLGCSTLALCANPALWHTPSYYAGVFHNQLARHGSGLWAPLGSNGADLVLVAIAAALTILALRPPRSLALWEGVALAGIAAATVHVERTGLWFLFLAAYPASRALGSLRAQPRRRIVDAALLIGLGAVFLVVRGPSGPGFGALVARAARSGEPVLAGPLTEQRVVLAGGRIWVGNPIDAFAQRDQLLYLDWILGKPYGAGALSKVGLVITSSGPLPAVDRQRGLRLVPLQSADGQTLYRVEGRCPAGRAAGGARRPTVRGLRPAAPPSDARARRAAARCGWSCVKRALPRDRDLAAG